MIGDLKNRGENMSKKHPSTLPDHNPSGLSVVDETKRMTEEILQFLRENVPDNRERSIAITNFEQAAMWAVKANFT